MNLVKKTKLTEVEDKIPDVSSLVTKTALTVVENKIADVSSLVKKTDYNTKTTEIEKNFLIIIITSQIYYYSRV